SKEAVFAKGGMVATNHYLATRVGVNVLEQGGNAFVAAVATALALNAVDMSMCGPGGASFWLIWNEKEKKLYGLDAGTQAPAAATPDKFADRSELLSGVKAMGIPGNMLAYWTVLEKFGTMPFEKVAAPAIRYLEEGFPLSHRQSHNYRLQAAQAPMMYPNLARVYAPDGEWPAAGEVVKNPELAATFRTVAKEGPDAFYKGSIAKEMVRYQQENGGLWTMEDLANYKLRWVEPIHMTYKGLDVYGMPAPSSSVTWMEALKIAEGFDWSKIEDNSLEYLHLMVEIARLAHADSYQYVVDPAFMENQADNLLSENYAASQRLRINLEKAAPGKVQPGDPIKWSKEPVKSAAELPMPLNSRLVSLAQSTLNMSYRGNTNHVVIVDKDGNCASFTHTLGQFFGGQDILGNTGVIGNNGMDWFDLGKNPWTEKESNLIVAPNKRNRWTLSPGMIFQNGKPRFLVGASGAESTMPGLFQALIRLLEYKYNPQAAITSPRFLYGDMYHYSAGTRLFIEPELRAACEEGMLKMGHEVVPASQIWRMTVGNVWAIEIDPDTGTYAGGAETRGDGQVEGY
ncbi:MAG: gamma-glutamyltransferase, partial [Mailhella sp.]|nr:gamma-glutamyltransferase [Mailhella sp.]